MTTYIGVPKDGKRMVALLTQGLFSDTQKEYVCWPLLQLLWSGVGHIEQEYNGDEEYMLHYWHLDRMCREREKRGIGDMLTEWLSTYVENEFLIPAQEYRREIVGIVADFDEFMNKLFPPPEPAVDLDKK